MQKSLVNCRSIETAVSRGRHLTHRWFCSNSVRQETECDKAEMGRGPTCDMSECVMESAAEREAYTWRASHILKHE